VHPYCQDRCGRLPRLVLITKCGCLCHCLGLLTQCCMCCSMLLKLVSALMPCSHPINMAIACTHTAGLLTTEHVWVCVRCLQACTPSSAES
jgi:hypothetical protein